MCTTFVYVIVLSAVQFEKKWTKKYRGATDDRNLIMQDDGTGVFSSIIILIFPQFPAVNGVTGMFPQVCFWEAYNNQVD